MINLYNTLLKKESALSAQPCRQCRQKVWCGWRQAKCAALQKVKRLRRIDYASRNGAGAGDLHLPHTHHHRSPCLAGRGNFIPLSLTPNHYGITVRE
ncbi:MAG: hypothetical protein ABSG35_19635 [Syntrophobacteraceae bacterium]